MSLSRELLSATVARSPAAVLVHDRAAWLGLFTDDAVVEDPVGAAPAAKAGGVLGRFYDTFIAPHDIRFEIRRDHVLGGDVFRDAVIHTRVRAGVEVRVPAYLLYQVVERPDGAAVRRMAAHWSLARMVGVAMLMGPRAWLAMTGLFLRMLRVMRLAWVAVYLASLWRGIGASGVTLAAGLSAALARRDRAGAAELFTPAAELELGGRRLKPEELMDALPPGCRLGIDGPVAAGWTVSFRFTLAGADPPEGLALLELDPQSRRIRRGRFFPPG